MTMNGDQRSAPGSATSADGPNGPGRPSTMMRAAAPACRRPCRPRGATYAPAVALAVTGERGREPALRRRLDDHERRPVGRPDEDAARAPRTSSSAIGSPPAARAPPTVRSTSTVCQIRATTGHDGVRDDPVGTPLGRVTPQQQVRRRPAEHHEPEALVHPPGDEVVVEHAEVRPAAAGGERVARSPRRSRAGPGRGPGTPAASRSTTGSSRRRTSSAGRSPRAPRRPGPAPRGTRPGRAARASPPRSRRTRSRLDVERLGEDDRDRPRRVVRGGRPAIRWTRSTVTSGRTQRRRGRPRSRSSAGRVERHQQARAVVLEPVAEQPRRRGRRGSSNPGIGQKCGIRSSAANSARVSVRRRSNASASVRPGDARDPVPERLAVGRVVEEHGVAERRGPRGRAARATRPRATPASGRRRRVELAGGDRVSGGLRSSAHDSRENRPSGGSGRIVGQRPGARPDPIALEDPPPCDASHFTSCRSPSWPSLVAARAASAAPQRPGGPSEAAAAAPPRPARAPRQRPVPPAPRPRPARPRPSTVEIKDFKFSPQPVQAKVGDVVGWTNGDSAPHTATLDDGRATPTTSSQGATGLLVFNSAGHVHLPLQDPPDPDEGLHGRGPVGPGHRRSGPAPPARAGRPAQPGRSTVNSVAPDSRSIDRRAGQPARREDLEEARRGCTSACPGTARRSGCPTAARPASDWESSSDDGRHQSRTTSRPPGAGPRPTPPAATRPGPAARAARPGSRRGRTRRRTASPDRRGPRSGSGSPRPASVTWRIARATESGSNSTPTSVVVGNRWATAISHLPPPQATSRTRPPAARRPRGPAAAARPSWKKTAMSWTVTASIARWNRGGRSAIGSAGPEEVRQRGVVEARDDRGDELAAEVLRAGCRRAAPSAVVGRASPAPRRTRRSRWRGRPGPTPRPAPAAQPAAVRQVGRRDARAPAARIRSNSPSSSPR